MAKTRQHVHMKDRPVAWPNEGRYALFCDGEMCGGSVHREGILTVLLSTIRWRAGAFKVVDEDTSEVLLEYDTDHHAWSGETMKEHVEKLSWTPKHEWKQERFYAGDEVDEEYCFVGWHRGERWNGWHDPWFRRDQVERIVAMVEEQGFDWDTYQGYRCQWVRDTLVVEDGNAQEVLTFEPKQIRPDLNDAPIMVYNLFGGGHFTWEVI